MPFDTYIEDRAMIPVLLGYDWMVSHGTWTDCPYETYMSLKKKVIHNGLSLIHISEPTRPY